MPSDRIRLRRPRKRVRPAKHYAALVSPQRGLYRCPTCGLLGGLAEGIEHAVANQYTYQEEPTA